LFDDKLPQNIVWRTHKVGYEPPHKQWMENPVMKEYIYEAKSKLIKADILKPQVLHKKTKSPLAYDADYFDWRYICAAHIIG
jgi:asparagine synthase (glutamine-hydrolysing)